MSGDDVLERELTAHLLERAAQAPGGDGWHGIVARVDRRRRRRQRVRVGAATLCLVAITGGLASLRGVGSDEGAPVDTGPAASPSGRLPHLVLDLPGYALEHASETYFGPEERAAQAQAGPTLSVLVRPGDGYDGPVLFVTTAPAGSGYGVGDQSPSARTVDVGGRTAWLQAYTGLPATSLGWYVATGRAVHLVALRLGDDDLVGAARTLVVGDDGTVSWPDASLPAGLAVRRSTVTPTVPRATAEVQYARGESRFTLRVQEGADAVLDDLVRDRAASALEIGETTVDGVPAVLTVYEGEDRSSLMWQVRTGVVAELVARNASAQPDVMDAAAAVAEIDEAAWQDLLDRFVEHAQAGASPVDSGDRLTSVTESMCDLRGRWLAADDAGSVEAARLMRSLRRHAVETGLDRDSDIVAVLDRLLAAMSVGDEATVRSIPEGGGCG